MKALNTGQVQTMRREIERAVRHKAGGPWFVHRMAVATNGENGVDLANRDGYQWSVYPSAWFRHSADCHAEEDAPEVVQAAREVVRQWSR